MVMESTRSLPTTTHLARPPQILAFWSLVLTGCALLAIDASVPGVSTALAEHFLSPDGKLSPRGQQLATQLFQLTAASCIFWGLAGLGWTLEPWRSRFQTLVLDDPFPSPSRPRLLAVSTTLLGLGCLGLYEGYRRLGLPLDWLFAKEGLLEHLTAALYGIAAVAMAVAAFRLPGRADNHASPLDRLSPSSRWGLSVTFWGLAALSFLIAMEEISWGQHLLGFSTPMGYKEVNVQGETNLHNLVAQTRLDHYTRVAALVVFATLSVGWVLLAAISSPFLQLLLPHASLLPLGYLTFVVAPYVHLEMLEVLTAIFAAIHAWRVRLVVKG